MQNYPDKRPQTRCAEWGDEDEDEEEDDDEDDD